VRVGRLEKLGHLVQVGVDGSVGALVHHGHAVALRQVLDRHLVAVEHHGLHAVHHALAGHVQLVEDPRAIGGRAGQADGLGVVLVVGDPGHAATGILAVPITGQLDRHVGDARALARIVDAVVVGVEPHHAGDMGLGQLDHAIAVIEAVAPVDVRPPRGAQQRLKVRQALLVGALQHLMRLDEGTLLVGEVAQLRERGVADPVEHVSQLVHAIGMAHRHVGPRRRGNRRQGVDRRGQQRRAGHAGIAGAVTRSLKRGDAVGHGLLDGRLHRRQMLLRRLAVAEIQQILVAFRLLVFLCPAQPLQSAIEVAGVIQGLGLLVSQLRVGEQAAQ